MFRALRLALTHPSTPIPAPVAPVAAPPTVIEPAAPPPPQGINGVPFERFAAMVESSPSNIMLATPEGVIVYMNKRSYDTLRTIEHELPVRVSEIVGNSFDVFHKNPGRVRGIVGDHRQLPHRAVISVGAEKLQLNVTPIFDEHRNYVGAMQSWDVVTKQLEAEARNADLMAQIAALSESQALIEFDLDGVILTANHNMLSVVGYSLDELKGKHHRLLLDQAERDSVEYREFWHRLRRGEHITSEFRRRARDGRELWLQATYCPVFGADGKPYKVLKCAIDVTDQVRMRAQMQSVIKGVTHNARNLETAAEQLTQLSQQMAANAEQTASQAQTVSLASTDVSSNVHTIASATEEMTASIREIAKNAADGARVASAAVEVASSANATVTKLGESSGEIGKVIKVITAIAHQTKLLALNATIEAARAGEAGKGFAVVANEVKELAKETAKATEDISAKIEAIQSDTGSAVDAITRISAIINQISDIQSSIAGAVEEQTATTNEMSRNLTETARGSSEIARNIAGMADAAKDTTVGATKSLAAARDLTTMAEALTGLVTTATDKKPGDR